MVPKQIPEDERQLYLSGHITSSNELLARTIPTLVIDEDAMAVLTLRI